MGSLTRLLAGTSAHMAELSVRSLSIGCLRWQCSKGGDAAKANMLLEYTGAVRSQAST